MIDVSIIVPVYKVERYIRLAVPTMLNQTHRNLEVILVDDGSPDDSGKICDEYAAQDPRVRVIHKQNEGTGAARNTGLDAAQGEYVYFCDPDDLLEPELIEENLRLAREHHADILSFGSRLLYYDSDNHEIRRDADLLPAESGAFTRAECAERYETCFRMLHDIWTKLFRREFLTENNVRSTTQKIGQDVLLVLDALTAPFSVIYFNQKAYYNHILHAGSATTNYYEKRFECELAAAIRKEKLIRSFNLPDERCHAIVVRGYVQAANMAFGAFSLWDAPKGMTTAQKIARLQEIVEEPNMKRALQNATYDMYPTKGAKLRLFLLKTRRFHTIVWIGNAIASRYRWKL